MRGRPAPSGATASAGHPGAGDSERARPAASASAATPSGTARASGAARAPSARVQPCTPTPWKERELMACTDYTKLNEQERRRTALREMKEADIPLSKAVSLIAISGTESSFIWTQPRVAPPALEFALSPCWHCRVPVGWEPQFKGNQRVLAPANKEAKARAFVLQNGLAVEGAGGELLPAGATLVPNSNGLVKWLEWAIAERRADLLINWSIGPTQMHLIWSDLYRPFQKMNATPDRLNTWEDVFDFLMTDNAGAVARKINYLNPGSKWNPAGTSWPADNPDNADKVINWLIGQLGNRADAARYYNSAYKRNLALVLADARAEKLIA